MNCGKGTGSYGYVRPCLATALRDILFNGDDACSKICAFLVTLRSRVVLQWLIHLLQVRYDAEGRIWWSIMCAPPGGGEQPGGMNCTTEWVGNVAADCKGLAFHTITAKVPNNKNFLHFSFSSHKRISLRGKSRLMGLKGLAETIFSPIIHIFY